MKANELRIGNLVEGIRIGKVKSIFITHFQVDDFDGITLGNSLQLNFKPIPLTEEWLLKFGFERHHADYSNDVIYIKNVPNNNEFIWGLYPFELGSGFVINKSKSLKYVHHLQNLYFALTGEELVVKE